MYSSGFKNICSAMVLCRFAVDLEQYIKRFYKYNIKYKNNVLVNPLKYYGKDVL